MSKIELDDQILNHPKFLRAVARGGSAAIHMWLGMRAYCSQYLTDGFVPNDMLDEVRGPSGKKSKEKALSALESAGLIHRAQRPQEAGWELHDYLDHASSREQVLEWRARSARRAALRSNPKLMAAVKARDANLCRYCGSKVDWSDHRSDVGGTYDHVVPISRGGGDELENVVTCCRRCNSSKGSRTPEQAGIFLLPPKTTGSAVKTTTGSLPDDSAENFRSSPSPTLSLNSDSHSPSPSLVIDSDLPLPKERGDRFVKCPPDLDLTQEQQGVLSTSLVPAWAIPLMRTELVGKWVNRPADKTLDQWRSYLYAAMLNLWKSDKRPRKPTPAAAEVQPQPPKPGQVWHKDGYWYFSNDSQGASA